MALQMARNKAVQHLQCQSGGIIVPPQEESFILDAFSTARQLGGSLASFEKAILDVDELAKAYNNMYRLIVDSRDMPTEKGYYSVCHELIGRSPRAFLPISDGEARALIDAGHGEKVLHIGHEVGASLAREAEQATPHHAVQLSLPVALFFVKMGDTGKRGFLTVDFYVGLKGVVALSGKQTSISLSDRESIEIVARDGQGTEKVFPVSGAAEARLLRKDKGTVAPKGDNITIAIGEGERLEIVVRDGQGGERILPVDGAAGLRVAQRID
ncbi:MAG: hypothetical protein KGH72_03230 [Candidatus Micrarchaeota archaeon]|nr:hypothetical protein [Candidatus Micrarchaeota archaeon]